LSSIIECHLIRSQPSIVGVANEFVHRRSARNVAARHDNAAVVREDTYQQQLVVSRSRLHTPRGSGQDNVPVCAPLVQRVPKIKMR
jgi:hypothetical protein